MIKCVLFNYACMYVHRGLVKWYNNGLQNHCWEFDSLIPCHVEKKCLGNFRSLRSFSYNVRQIHDNML